MRHPHPVRKNGSCACRQKDANQQCSREPKVCAPCCRVITRATGIPCSLSAHKDKPPTASPQSVIPQPTRHDNLSVPTPSQADRYFNRNISLLAYDGPAFQNIPQPRREPTRNDLATQQRHAVVVFLYTVLSFFFVSQ